MARVKILESALNHQLLLERSYFKYWFRTTAKLIIKNQTEKNNDVFPLNINVMKSWIRPQKTNVIISETAGGKFLLSGLNILLPK